MSEIFTEIKTEESDFSADNERKSSEFILPEFFIKQESELILENQLEVKNGISEEDRLSSVWHECIICEERFLSAADLLLHAQNHIKSEESLNHAETTEFATQQQKHSNDKLLTSNICDRRPVKRIYNRVKNCIVPGCDVNSVLSPHEKFICFPSYGSDKFNLWMKLIGRNDLDLDRKKLYICRKHFASDCFGLTGLRLTKYALPTLFIPTNEDSNVRRPPILRTYARKTRPKSEEIENA